MATRKKAPAKKKAAAAKKKDTSIKRLARLSLPGYPTPGGRLLDRRAARGVNSLDHQQLLEGQQTSLNPFGQKAMSAANIYKRSRVGEFKGDVAQEEKKIKRQVKRTGSAAKRRN